MAIEKRPHSRSTSLTGMFLELPMKRRRASQIKLRILPILALFTSISMMAMPEWANAEPHSTAVKIIEVRVVSSGGSSPDVAYIYTGPTSICGGATLFSLPFTNVYGQGTLSAALTAATTGAYATIEISNSTGCTTQYSGGPQILSISIVANGSTAPY
jgi:hypothetical protein